MSPCGEPIGGIPWIPCPAGIEPSAIPPAAGPVSDVVTDGDRESDGSSTVYEQAATLTIPNSPTPAISVLIATNPPCFEVFS
jgi:hypothetical protein